MRQDLNGHYCLATKEHYDKLIEDGCKLLGPHECITPKEQAYFYHVCYGYITYCTKEYNLNDIVPMHLHNNSWVFSSLEHEEEATIEEVCECYDAKTKVQVERINKANIDSFISGYTESEIFEMMLNYIEYLETNQKDNS